MLSSLTISGSTLIPSFSPVVYSYVCNATQSKYVLVNATKVDSSATLSVNRDGTYFANNSYVALNEGVNTIEASVTKGANSNVYTATITMSNPVTLVESGPENTTVADGGTATFTVVPVSGANVESYLWQESSTGMVWRNAYTTNVPTLNIHAQSRMNNYRYRCVMINANGYADITNSAKLTVTS